MYLDFDIYLYTDGTYVDVEVITELYSIKEKGTPAIKAQRERRRICNKNERVQRSPSRLSKGADPKGINKQTQPTHLQTLTRAGIQSNATPCDACRDHHSENKYRKVAIVRRWGASRLNETKARAVALVKVRTREGALGGGTDGTVSAGHASSERLRNSAAAVAEAERAGADADDSAVASAGSAVTATRRGGGRGNRCSRSSGGGGSGSGSGGSGRGGSTWCEDTRNGDDRGGSSGVNRSS